MFGGILFPAFPSYFLQSLLMSACFSHLFPSFSPYFLMFSHIFPRFSPYFPTFSGDFPTFLVPGAAAARLVGHGGPGGGGGRSWWGALRGRTPGDFYGFSHGFSDV